MTRKNKIPKFKTIQEEAEFWDTHDTTDFEDEFMPTRMRYMKNLSEGITIRFDPETLQTLRQVASKKGIGATTLIRMWVLEQVGRVKNMHAKKNVQLGVDKAN